jgi:hypothetical protein
LARPVYIAISLLSTIALWWLRQKYPFLGDGHIRSSELDSGIVHTSGRTFIQFLLYVSTAFQLTGRETYQIVNTLLGIPFVFLTLLVSHEVGTSTLSRVLSATLIGCSGIIQYYAGYMEVYAPLPILMLLSIWLALRGDRSTLSRYGSAVVSLGAFLIHPLCSVLIPPSLYLIWHRDVRGRNLSRRRAFLAFILGGLAAAYFTGLFEFAQKVLLPFIASPDRSYAAFTVTNFWERLNGFILCAPAAIPLAFILSRSQLTSIEDCRTRYLWIAASMGVLSVLVFDFVLGSQDWDVMAKVTFPICVLCANAISKLREDILASISVPMAAICLLSTFP